MFDVIVIGAGVSGAASAREISKYKGRILVLEKKEDVCSGISKANSAIVHAGFDAETGSLKAEMNVKGNKKMPQLAKELDIPFRQCGSLVVCNNTADIEKLEELFNRGLDNGVEGMEVITDVDRIRTMEENIADDVVAALYAPSAGIVCPFELNLAMAENAYDNGVEFKFNTEVVSLDKTDHGWKVETNNGTFETKCVVNAAGIYAGEFHNMVSEKKIHITPRRGDYMLLDKSAGEHVNHTIFMLPNEFGKGVLVTPTVHGNLLVGPTAIDIENKEGTATTREGLDQIVKKSKITVKDIPLKQVITSFAGLRPHEDRNDFIIEEVEDAPGFIDVAGIESPGLVSCPAVGERVAEIVQGILNLEENTEFDGTRKGLVHTADLSKAELNQLIKEKPAYGNIVCRCEMITEGEIVKAIRRPIGAKSLDGIKRRTRAGMGRCQAGFCSAKTLDILHRELGIPMDQITKSGGESKLIVGTNKDSF